MPILGIDGDKCIQCGECVRECPALLFAKGEDGTISYADPTKLCIRCGHCVAVCPTDAILHERMEGVDTFPGVESPETLIDSTNFYRLLRAKRSIRWYKKNPLSRPILDKIFAAIQHAPTGANLRTIKYTLISDPEKMNTISDAACKAISGNALYGAVYGNIIKIKLKLGLDPIFCGAPHVLIAESSTDAGFEVLNAGIAFTYAMLLAETLGVGSCWCGMLQMAVTSNKEIQKMLGIRGKLLGAVMLGLPDISYHRAPSRKPLKIREL